MSVLLLLAAFVCARIVHRPLLGQLGVGTLQHLVRLPGNLLHELSHAGVMYATGYTVVGFRVSLLDPAGRGGVKPGPSWTGLARPWLTNLLSPVAPAVVGVAALVWLYGWGGVPGLPTSMPALRIALAVVPWRSWELWASLALAYSVAAEMTPSDVDLAAWWRPALVFGLVAAAAGWGLWTFDPTLAGAIWPNVNTALLGPASRSLAIVCWSGLVMTPVMWGLGRLLG